jgi:uncharacterized protein YjgD (DUF1641 family)
MHDIMPIATTLVERASVHLQEVEDYVDIPYLVSLLKKVARHTPHLEGMLDQLESISELVEVAAPISKDLFHKAETVLDQLDKKGYFAFARGGARILDNIVSSFTAEEVDRLGDNIVLILRTVKDMTQPEIMTFLRDTVEAVEKDADTPVDIGYGALLGQLRDPKTRRGLAVAMRALGKIGGSAETK